MMCHEYYLTALGPTCHDMSPDHMPSGRLCDHLPIDPDDSDQVRLMALVQGFNMPILME